MPMDPVKAAKFGWGKVRPAFLQWLNNPKWLLVFLCLYFLSMSVMLNGTYSVSISTVEKRFGLSSSTSGLITSMYDIACLAVTAFVGYYGGHQSKPRWLGGGLIFLALGSFIFMLPHLIIGPYQPVGTMQSEFPALCEPNSTNASHGACESTTPAGQWYYAFLFCAGMLVIGLGGSPLYVLGTAYLDESVKKKVSSMYIGIFGAAGVVGAAVGFGLGSVFLSMHVDLVETSITPSDSRWIGNWWLGSVFLIVMSLLLLPGMTGFPRVLRGDPRDDNELKDCNNMNDEKAVITPKKIDRTTLKGFLADTKILFTSPSFVFLALGISCEFFTVAASIAFLPKIITVVFNFPPNKVSLLYGLAVMIPILFGQLAGAYMVKRLKLGAVGAIKAVCFISVVHLVVVSCYAATNCDNSEILGVTKDFGNSTFQTISSCGIPCDCNRWPYYPVCDGNITFWSPCHARCSSYSKKDMEFQGCLCTESNSSLVKPGKCGVDCGAKPIVFILIIAFTGFLTFLTHTPLLIAILRSVPYRLRAYAVGWEVNCSRLLGSIPGPIIFGKLIDTACIQWEKTCDGRGSCQEYDHWKLVLIITIVMVTLRIVNFSCCVLALKFLRKDLFEKVPVISAEANVLVQNTN